MSRTQKILRYRNAMEQAMNYEEWKEAALELDYLEGHYEWKQIIESSLYNYEEIAGRLAELRRYQGLEDKMGLLRSLREGLNHDLGNMGNIELYSRCNFGTKELIEEYVDQVCYSLDWVCDNSISILQGHEKLKYFREIARSFGRPALLLSGGASLGLFHIGTVKALWERGLLPHVISGSSAGSIVAGLVGSIKEDELPEIFDPKKLAFSPWRQNSMSRFLSGQGVMDQRQLEFCLREMMGDCTFQEAWEMSGRSINITVSPTKSHQQPILLSGYTSPYMLMWSASLASSAVPKVFPPVMLKKRNRDGLEVPYMPENRYVDGSVNSDIPMERLRHLYDVNYAIVSQTNPFVTPFLKGHDEKEVFRLRDLPKNMLRGEFTFHSRALCDHLRKHSNSEVVKQVSGFMHNLMDQNYYGDVTIVPRYKFRHYASAMKNPDAELISELMIEGERRTWPKISMIRTHSKISQTLTACVQRLKARIETEEVLNGKKKVEPTKV